MDKKLDKNTSRPLYAYFGHHKCASQWIKAILYELCKDINLRFGAVYNQKLANQPLKMYVKTLNLDFVAYVTAQQEQVNTLENFRGFHIIRDPRDICVSAYYSHLYSHPINAYNAEELIRTRNLLERLSKDEGLFYVIKERNPQFEAMYNWSYTQVHILELKMEQLTQNPYQTFLDIFAHLGLLDSRKFSINKQGMYLLTATINRIYYKLNLSSPYSLKKNLPAEKILGQVYDHQFAKKSQGRKPGEEDVHNHYRKGISGDWVNHFKPEHTSYFKKAYNKVLIKLGYEVDDDW